MAATKLNAEKTCLRITADEMEEVVEHG